MCLIKIRWTSSLYRYKCMHQKKMINRQIIIVLRVWEKQFKLYRGCPTGRGHVERRRNHLEASKQTLDKMHVEDPHQPETYVNKNSLQLLSETTPMLIYTKDIGSSGVKIKQSRKLFSFCYQKKIIRILLVNEYTFTTKISQYFANRISNNNNRMVVNS